MMHMFKAITHLAYSSVTYHLSLTYKYNSYFTIIKPHKTKLDCNCTLRCFWFILRGMYVYFECQNICKKICMFNNFQKNESNSEQSPTAKLMHNLNNYSSKSQTCNFRNCWKYLVIILKNICRMSQDQNTSFMVFSYESTRISSQLHL